MENHVFQKARTKEEYLGYVARLILHVREMNSKKGTANGVPGANQGAPGVSDAINALQTLAIQATRNPLMTMGGPQQGPIGTQQQITATNLLQTLNQGPGQTMNPNMQQNMQPRPNMGIGPNGGPLTNQMGNQIGGQISNQMANQLGGQMANNGVNQIPNQMDKQMQGPVQNQLPNQLPGQSQMGGSTE